MANNNNKIGIKEISLVSTYVFMNYNEYWYKDLLRISEHWISYRRNSFHTGKTVLEWSYRTSRNNQTWSNLIEEVVLNLKDNETHVTITDVPTFNLRITYNDDTHKDYSYSSSFSFNKLDSLADLIKKMIPVEEKSYPDVLNNIPLFFKTIALTRENLKNLKKEDVCALMYAEGGAMGSPGEVSIIDVNGNKYHTAGFCDDDGCDISQIEVIDGLFDGFKHVDGFISPNYSECFINDSRWMYLYLGFGNHLYLRDDFWLEHGNRIIDVNPANRYMNWNHILKD